MFRNKEWRFAKSQRSWTKVGGVVCSTDITCYKTPIRDLGYGVTCVTHTRCQVSGVACVSPICHLSGCVCACVSSACVRLVCVVVCCAVQTVHFGLFLHFQGYFHFNTGWVILEHSRRLVIIFTTRRDLRR